MVAGTSAANLSHPANPISERGRPRRLAPAYVEMKVSTEGDTVTALCVAWVSLVARTP
jgi:hypothetical protein